MGLKYLKVLVCMVDILKIHKLNFSTNVQLSFLTKQNEHIYVSLQLCVQNAVSAQPCVGKFQISLVLLNFLHCNFRLWFETT